MWPAPPRPVREDLGLDVEGGRRRPGPTSPGVSTPTSQEHPPLSPLCTSVRFCGRPRARGLPRECNCVVRRPASAISSPHHLRRTTDRRGSSTAALLPTRSKPRALGGWGWSPGRAAQGTGGERGKEGWGASRRAWAAGDGGETPHLGGPLHGAPPPAPDALVRARGDGRRRPRARRRRRPPPCAKGKKGRLSGRMGGYAGFEGRARAWVPPHLGEGPRSSGGYRREWGGAAVRSAR